MGRPTKRGLKFFSFDTDFFENDKIQLIEAEFGNNGSHILIRLLAKIYKEGYFYQWGRDQCLLLDRATGREYGTELINKIVDACVQRNFFDKSLYDKYSILTSPEVQYRYSVGVAKRTDIVIIEEYWLIDDEPNCEFEWIKLVANSDGIVIPIFNESEPILSEIDEQTIQEANTDYEPQINYRKKPPPSELLPEETPYIRLDYIKEDNNIKDTCSELLQSSKPVVYKLPTNRFDSIGEEYGVEEDFYNEMQTYYPALDVMTELRQMRAWLVSNQAKRKTFNGMKKFINNWLSKSTNQGKGNPNEQYKTINTPSTRRSNGWNAGQANTAQYPACSDGRHPGDLAPEEYARAKAAAEAKYYSKTT